MAHLTNSVTRAFRLTTAAVLAFVASAAVSRAAAPAEVSFRNDVMAVLSKTGCNSGACHGNRAGKGGFKLSLRGEDPVADYEAVARELVGRRVNTTSPADSLVLLKPSTAVPHEGGLRLDAGSEHYEVLRRWIDDGARDDRGRHPTLTRLEVTPAERFVLAPAQSAQIKAVAHFSDGSKCDVTRLACYEANNHLPKLGADGLVTVTEPGETTVMVRYLHLQQPVTLAFVPHRPGFRWSRPSKNNFVDEHVFAKLEKLRLNPAPLCVDEVFLRRAYLDLLGTLPTPDEARAFVADRAKDKRARLVDQLLARPEFADFWALKWADLLRNEERTLDEKGVKIFHTWIRGSIAENKPLNVFAAELLAARGSTYTNGAANFYRALRTPVERAEAVGQVFLGTRLQCAACHNHPFDRWTMDDYYDWAGVFARVDYKIIENKRTDKSDKHEFKGEQLVQIAALNSKNKVTNQRTGQPAVARLLGEAKPLQPGEGEDELLALAKWLGRPNNTVFARMQANRIWYHLMGRGLVDPLDDFRATNPPSHPKLMDALTQELVKSKFDLRHLIRLIMNSRAYQLAAAPVAGQPEDPLNYSHVMVRRLFAEQLLDATSQAAGAMLEFKGFPDATRAGQLPGPLHDGRKAKSREPVDEFLAAFGKPPRLVSSECERVSDPALGQAFQMMSGPVLTDVVSRKDNRLGALLAAGKSTPEIIEELYWAALTRPPTADESRQMAAVVERAGDRRAALEDVLWALLNAKEFLLRH
jgi:hypothetical protein